jgi:hypothetical protein
LSLQGVCAVLAFLLPSSLIAASSTFAQVRSNQMTLARRQWPPTHLHRRTALRKAEKMQQDVELGRRHAARLRRRAQNSPNILKN